MIPTLGQVLLSRLLGMCPWQECGTCNRARRSPKTRAWKNDPDTTCHGPIISGGRKNDVHADPSAAFGIFVAGFLFCRSRQNVRTTNPNDGRSALHRRQSRRKRLRRVGRREICGLCEGAEGRPKSIAPPGEHEISIRQAGYEEIKEKLVVAPGQVQTVAVVLKENPKMIYPGNNAAELRLDIRPKRAAVFVDGGYMGHGSDFGGRFHSVWSAPANTISRSHATASGPTKRKSMRSRTSSPGRPSSSRKTAMRRRGLIRVMTGWHRCVAWARFR